MLSYNGVRRRVINGHRRSTDRVLIIRNLALKGLGLIIYSTEGRGLGIQGGGVGTRESLGREPGNGISGGIVRKWTPFLNCDRNEFLGKFMNGLCRRM